MENFLKEIYKKLKKEVKIKYKKTFASEKTILWFFEEGVQVFGIKKGLIVKIDFFDKEFYVSKEHIFSFLDDNGYKAKNIYIIGNDDSVKIKRNIYPLLSDEEFSGMLDLKYIEEENNIHLATYRVESKSFEEEIMSVYVAECLRENYENLIEYAKKEKKQICGIIPFFEVAYDTNRIILYQNGKDVRLLKGHIETRKRKFKIDELEEYFKDKKIVHLRTSKTTLEDAKKAYENLGNDVVSDINEEGRIDLIADLKNIEMCFELSKGRKFNYSKEEIKLKLAQVLCIFSVIFLITMLAIFTQEYIDFSNEKSYGQTLIGIEKEKMEYTKKLKAIENKYEKIKKLQEMPTFEEAFLIDLAEAVIDGVTISEIETNENTVRIKGNANTRENFRKFEKNLKSQYKNVTNEKTELKNKGVMIEFNLICEK